MTRCLTLSQFPQIFLTNPSKLRIYLCKIPTDCDHRKFDSINQPYKICTAIDQSLRSFVQSNNHPLNYKKFFVLS
jgi:hypothetical protein